MAKRAAGPAGANPGRWTAPGRFAEFGAGSEQRGDVPVEVGGPRFVAQRAAVTLQRVAGAGDHAAGLRGRGWTSSPGSLRRTLAYTYEVVENDPHRLMRTAQGPFPMQTTYTWTPEGESSTRMTLRNSGEPTTAVRWGSR